MLISLPAPVSQVLQNTQDILTEQAVKTENSMTKFAENLRTSLSETTDVAKEELSQTTNQAILNLNQVKETAVETVAETTEKAENYLFKAANQAFSIIGETTNKALVSVGQTTDVAKDAIANTTSQALNSVNVLTEKAKEGLTETTNQAVNAVSEVTNQAVGKIDRVTQNAKDSLEETIQKAENLSQSFSEGVQTGMTSFLNDWLNQHPIIFWVLNHPIQSLAIGLLIIFLIAVIMQGLMRAIVTLTEKTWITILKSPFKLGGSVLGLGLKSLGKPKDGIEDGFSNNSNRDREQQIANIINRLNGIKQEQELLLNELVTLLKTP